MSYKSILDRRSLEVDLDEYLSERLRDAGYGGMKLEKTPIGYKLTVKALRPGLVIGHRGVGIRSLTEDVAERYKLENLTISVAEVPVPELNPRIMATRILQMVERGMPFRRATNIILKAIMGKGALGCEIVISGKLRTERSHTGKFRSGIIPKSGRPAEVAVKEAKASVTLKLGMYGVKVRIVDPDLLQPLAKLKEEAG